MQRADQNYFCVETTCMIALRFKPCIRKYNPEIIPQILLKLAQMPMLMDLAGYNFKVLIRSGYGHHQPEQETYQLLKCHLWDKQIF